MLFKRSSVKHFAQCTDKFIQRHYYYAVILLTELKFALNQEEKKKYCNSEFFQKSHHIKSNAQISFYNFQMRLITVFALLIIANSQLFSFLFNNCKTYTPDGFRCATCPSYLQLDSAGNCKSYPLLSNCNIYNATCANQCSSCASGYQLSSSGSCYLIIANCTTYTNVFACSKCASGYTLSNGACIIANCLNSSNNVCITCVKGFTLTTTCVCLISQSSCGSYDSVNSVCLTCLTGYTLTSLGTCLWLPFCKSYDVQTGLCSQCLPNFSYNNQSKQCQSIFCSQYNSSLPVTGRICSLCQTSCSFDSSKTYCIPPGCSNYNLQNGTCIACNAGYQLNSSNGCTVSNCQTFNADKSCATCISGYTLVVGICKQNPYQCTQADSQGNCLQCATYFQLTQGNCIAFGCSLYNISSYICSSCISGYVIKDQICQLQNCASMLNSTYCGQCATNYTLYNGYCYTPVSNCNAFNSTTFLCSGCASNYYLAQQNGIYSCILLPNYCLTVDSLGNCLLCTTGNIIYNDLCVPSNSIANCQNYSLPTFACLVCVSGYYLGANSICTALPPNCANVNANRICQQCVSGYTLIGQNCLTTIPNCSTYSPTGQCMQCGSGYVFYNGYCYTPVPNCVSFNSTASLCNGCASNYYLIQQNGLYSCVLLPNYCLTVDSLGNCLSCTTGNIVYNKLCVPSNSIANCQDYSLPTLTCITCLSGYYLTSNSLCSALPPNCANVDVNGNCQQCLSGYTLVGQSCFLSIANCTSYDYTGSCQACSIGFTLFNQICYVTVNNCSLYNVNGQCQQCINGFTLVGQSCFTTLPNCGSYSTNGLQCLQCNTGYTLYNGYCYTPVSNCSTFNSSSFLCSGCNSGYYLVLQNGIYSCVLLPNYCLTVDYSGNCLSCTSGNIIYNRLCVPNISIANCLNYSITSFTCLVCVGGYYIGPNSICLALPSNCANVNLTGICIQCLSGYTLVDQNCFRTISNCSSYNSTGQCLQCVGGSTIVGQNCYVTVNYCATYNANGLCQQCVNGYTIVGQNCVNTIKNCSSYSTDGLQCLQCNTGYTLYNGYCYTPVPNCTVFNSTTFLCSGCASNYYLVLQNGLYSCVLLPNYCLTVNYIGNCLSCTTGNVIYNSRCVPNTSIANCQNYSLPTFACLVCVSGYYLGANSICTALPPNCGNANANGICQQCVSGYTLVGQKCLTTIPNCGTYAPTGQCQQCNSGCTISQDNLTCSTFSQSCQFFIFPGFCIICKPYHYLQISSCIPYPTGCTQLIFNKYCTSCAAQYTLFASTCLQSVANCSTYNSSGCCQCVFSYYLYNHTCTPFPPNCISFDNTLLRCLTCASGFTLNSTSFNCYKPTITGNISNCANYSTSTQCILCLPRYYLKANVCLPNPQYCANADSLGNCLSCCLGSNLLGGACVANSYRGLNCLSFDSVNKICLVCNQGYSFCSQQGICLYADSNCLNPSSDGVTCLQCNSIYQLFSGKCLMFPTEITIAPNGGVSCPSNCILSNNTCYRDPNSLTKLSTILSSWLWGYSSHVINNPPTIGSSSCWNPPVCQLSDYIGITSSAGVPKMIHQISIKGNGLGWVSAYTIQYRSQPGAQLTCWNNCTVINGNSDGINTSILQLQYPIVASELRIYPTRWSNQVNLQVECWMQ